MALTRLREHFSRRDPQDVGQRLAALKAICQASLAGSIQGGHRYRWATASEQVSGSGSRDLRLVKRRVNG
jgi:hypothetical protein